MRVLSLAEGHWRHRLTSNGLAGAVGDWRGLQERAAVPRVQGASLAANTISHAAGLRQLWLMPQCHNRVQPLRPRPGVQGA